MKTLFQCTVLIFVFASGCIQKQHDSTENKQHSDSEHHKENDAVGSSKEDQTSDLVGKEGSCLQDQIKCKGVCIPQFFGCETDATKQEDCLIRFTSAKGSFEKVGRSWQEKDSTGNTTFSFQELTRDRTWLYLFDVGRKLYIRLPLQAGMAYYSIDEKKTWVKLFSVTPRLADDCITCKKDKECKHGLCIQGTCAFCATTQKKCGMSCIPLQECCPQSGKCCKQDNDCIEGKYCVKALCTQGCEKRPCCADSGKGSDISPPQPIKTDYKTFNGQHTTVYAWPGQRIVFQSMSKERNPCVMRRLLAVFDKVDRFYQQVTLKSPSTNKQFRGMATITEVTTTCGAGCGLLGATGIELETKYFEILYNGVRDKNEFDQVLFYEFGRNYWLFQQQLGYPKTSGGVIATGFAVFMRFMSVEATKVSMGPFGSVSYQKLKSEVEGLVDIYVKDGKLDWSTTLKVNKAPKNALNLGGTDLFASMMMRLYKIHGISWLNQVWKEAARLNKASSTQDAVDNLLIATSKAANKNLSSVFKLLWKTPISDTAQTKLAKEIGPAASIEDYR